MRPINKEKILKEGTMREKIKLYFIHIAERNISGEDLLTEDEINAIYFNIEAPQDVRYYSGLRRYNKTFLILTPRLQALKNKLLKHIAEVLLVMAKIELIVAQENSFNAISELLLKNRGKQKEDENLKGKIDKIRKKLIEDSYELTGEEKRKEIQELVKSINESTENTKIAINQMKYLLTAKLPLPPYKEYLKDEEKQIKEAVKRVKTLIEKHLEDRKMEIPPIKEHENGGYYIQNWEDIEINVDLVDLERYIKLANE